jgi:uncharacterized protein YggT (Ycf19 family)
MVERVEKVSRVEPADTAAPVQQTSAREVREVSEVHTSPATVAERVIWFVAGVILILLAFRFVLALLGANPSNGFANFIYSTSHPFVAPFFSLFNYNNLPVDHIGRFEVYTLVAMAVYTAIAWGLSRLVTIGHPPSTAVSR